MSTTGILSDDTTGSSPSVRPWRVERRDGKYTLERTFPFDRVYTLVAQGRRDRALDVVFEEMASAFERDDWTWCDAVLRAISLERVDSHVAIGFLSSTYVVRDRLGARQDLIDRMRQWLPTQGKTPSQVDSLLLGMI